MMILRLTTDECLEILSRLRFGRLACARENQPYIVPMYFAYHDWHLYCFSTFGRKIEWMRVNPLVCMEADEVIDHHHWSSVIVQGHYEELPDVPQWREDRQRAYGLLQQQAEWWEPAYVATAHVVTPGDLTPLFYRIHVEHVFGRCGKPDPAARTTTLGQEAGGERQGWLKSLVGHWSGL